ncbi:conserved hypothetical protein [Leptospira interrogans serovar Copenhageni str. Fiocruz L1-130]|uniref:Uncharacterized protein n=2 Tax=Leptospira interrogans serogroup Icterohaemorrhagiae serovar copenhageni TaxID=44275 RepID=Q72RG0_LEPIC|nr:conserved hypothetical protein [Leptospira interrogans serovar Copenhageni str. Fiocruz L1-130]
MRILRFYFCIVCSFKKPKTVHIRNRLIDFNHCMWSDLYFSVSFFRPVLLTLLKNKESRLVSSSFLQTISVNKNK